MKKLICIILSALFLVGMLPVSAFADNGSTADTHDAPKRITSESPSNVATLEPATATSGYYHYFVSYGKATISGCDELISGAVTIPSTLGGYPVTSIGSSAFSYCTGLTSVTIPDSVTSIEDYAFSDCTGLTSITIGKGVTSIGKYTFYKCTGLTSITIPDSVTSIGRYAFQGCTGLTSITIGKGVTRIGNDAFSYCTGLTSITIPDSVTSIGSAAFFCCTGLTSVTIPDSVTSIGSAAFRDCTGLTSITIPDSVKSIGDYTFYNCTGLTSVTIPDSVTSIGSAAFYDCTGLTGITIPDSVTSIGDFAFSGCTGLTSITIPDSVTSIGDYAFSCCTGLTSITIPDSVTSIGSAAFSDCTGLTSITIGKGVTSIGDYAFYYCTGLTSITIGKGVTSIVDYAFEGCTGLTSVTIPDSVTSIGDYAFSYCTGLTSVTIPDSVTSIGSSAFSDCTGLTSITIPYSVTSISPSAFQYCTNLTIKCHSESYAQQYAIENSIPYENIHFYTSEVTTPATCTEEGVRTFSCYCGDTYTENIAPGHSFTNYKSNNDAQCTVDGTKTAKCDRCDVTDTITDVGSAKGHTPGNWQVIKESTYSETGIRIKKCKKCQTETERETIPVLTNQFQDIPADSWYTEPCLWCNANGYITGTTATAFNPNGKLTRAMFVQILAKVDGVDLASITYNGKFTDVKSNNWFAKAVQWAVDCGVTGGTGANSFSPNTAVTREQLATFFFAYAKYKGYDISATVSLTKYKDASTISSWAKNAVTWAVAEGLISGTSETTVSPKTSATRAQAAVIFKNFVENYVSKQK